MKTKILILLTIINSVIRADTLHIYLNTSTCKSCNLIGKQLEKYQGFSMILYLSNNDFQVKEEILASYNLNPMLYQIKTVANNFYKYNDRSYCVLEKEKKLIDTFLLGETSKLKNFLTSEIRPAVKLKVDKRIKISDAAAFSVFGNYILINDYKVTNIYLAQQRGDSIILIESFAASTFKIDEFLKCSCFNEELYRYLMPTLIDLNLTRPEIEACNIRNNTLSIMLGLNVGVTAKYTPDTIIFKKLFVFSKDLLSGKSNFICVNAEGNYETDNILSRNFAVINYDFIKSGDTLYLPIVSNDSTKKSLFVKQMISDKKVRSLDLTKDLSQLVPSSLKFMFGTNGRFLSRAINGTDYYFIKVPLIYNIGTQTTFFINNLDLLKRLESDSAYISDSKTINGVAHILLKTNNVWYREEYELSSNKMLKSKALNIDKSISSVLFSKKPEAYLMFSYSKMEIYLLD